MASDFTFRPPRQPLAPPDGADLHARDMTATFGAEITLRDAQRRLDELGQWLPVDGEPHAPLGTLVDYNSTGPLRLGYGAWRDVLLGVQFTNGRGELITAGGRTVKNVAGYDLTKFMVGQRGAFGRLVTVTARTYRRPAAALLTRYAPEYPILSNLLPTALRPQWAVLTGDGLLCGYLADATTVDWYAATVRATEPVSVYRRSIEVDTDHRTALWASRQKGASFRASVPPSRVLDFVASAGIRTWSADAAFGVVVGPVGSPDEARTLRHGASALGGTVTFSGRPEGSRDSFAPPDVASTSSVEQRIIERLKAAFDPENQLSPLPWQTR
jgi:hypothetical protein